MATATFDPAPAVETDSVFKPALLLMSGRTLAFAATFFIPLILARILDPAQFGTYKQLFLVWGTVYFIAQLGMASSLYYFLPGNPGMAGAYVANSVLFLGGAGVVCFAGLVLAANSIGRWLSNPALAGYIPWIGLYIFLMMLATALEMVLIARGQYAWASTSYALSDVARAAAFILPVLMFRQLEWLLKGAVLVALLRVAVSFLYFRGAFRGSLKPDKALLRSQLAYALPFGLAVMVEILQASLPQYVVSHMFDPATFAIFAVGCLQIPLVDFAASPTSDVMMVKMQERLAEGRLPAVLQIWHDTTWKLALLFLPLTAFLMVNAREIITLLYTGRYAASVPIFAVWSGIILLTILQVDGVLRVFAETRFLLVLNLVRLAIIAGLIRWFLSEFGLLGGALVTVLATSTFKVAALARMKRHLGIRAADLLPWRNLAALAGAAICAAMVVAVIKSLVSLPVIPLLGLTGTAYTITYFGLVWGFDLLNRSERMAIEGWLRKIGIVAAGTVD